MRREGSALHGFGVVALKEIADHFSSILIVVLVVLVTASAIVVVSLGINPIKESTAEDPFLFLRLFTRSTPLALPELLYSADMARSITFNTSPIVLAAAIYVAMLWPIVRLVSRLERRVAS